jgi:pimeloyl-ACP methyl ester carboxylesterase
MDAGERSAPGMTLEAPEPTTVDETPMFFDAGGKTLFGVVTRPTASPLGVSLISAAGGMRGTSMGRNRLMVRLSRQAARSGFLAIRFDYHGVGESAPPAENFSMHAPFDVDLDGATRLAESLGVKRHVYAGVCFGARTVMTLGPSRPGVIGVVLVEPWVRDGGRQGRKLTRYGTGQLFRMALRPWVLAGLFKREQRAYYAKFVRAKIHAMRSHDEAREELDLSWVSDRFLSPLRGLAERGIPVLFVYGDDSESYREFRRAEAGELGAILQAAGERVQVLTLPGQIHGFSDLLSQQRVIDAVEGWAARLTVGAGAEESKGGEPLA